MKEGTLLRADFSIKQTGGTQSRALQESERWCQCPDAHGSMLAHLTSSKSDADKTPIITLSFRLFFPSVDTFDFFALM